MIDLRSDTVTLPTSEMLQTILTAPLGDDSRRKEDNSGGDDTVLALEQLGASLTGKEAALLFPSGTMGNLAALYSVCERGDSVVLDPLIHMYVSEKTAFDPRFGGLKAVFCDLDGQQLPNPEAIAKAVSENGAKLVCIENTHNFAGGTVVPPQRIRETARAAHEAGALLHMDGARLFNAAAALEVEARELCAEVDSVMFCLSKGLGAPVGSLLCGSTQRIRQCRELRKLLGGSMRQAGVLAAPAIYALQHNTGRLREDHENAACFAAELQQKCRRAKVLLPVQTNIVLVDVSACGKEQSELLQLLQAHGVLAHKTPGYLRFTFHLGISGSDALRAAEIVSALLG